MFATRERKQQTSGLAPLHKKQAPRASTTSTLSSDHSLDPTYFLQRYLGNSSLKSMVEDGQARSDVPTLQRACACGGTCSSCAGHEHESGKIQPKLIVGQPGDVYEREADQVAETVMHLPEPQTPQDAPMSGEVQGNDELRRQPLAEEEEEETLPLQAKEISATSPSVSPDLATRIHTLRGGGPPLPAFTRAFFEPRFGYDFSPVWVHTYGAVRQGLGQTGVAHRSTDVRGNSDKELLNCLYTQGADPIAEQVMRMPVPKLQHACLCSGGCSKCQTKKPSQEYEYLQTKRVQPGNTGQIAAPPIVHDVLSTPGQPLDRATRNFMEPRFGHDFSQVRVHTDVKAAKSALAVNAYAYTLGRNVVFGAGQYSPHTREGQSLLAHELTHVIQQSDGQSTIGIGGPRVQKAPTDTLRRFEVPPNFPEIVIEETVERQLKKKVTSPALWRHFWKVVIKKFALRGGIAVTLAAADGPFPIGDLISLGMTLWMIWDMYQLWDELWREAQLESDLDFEAFLEPEFELELEPTAGSRRTRKQRGFDEGEGYEDDVVPDKEKRKTGRDHRKAADPNRNIDPNDPCLGRKPCSDLGSDYRDASPDDIRGEVINKEGGVYDAGQTVTSTDPFCQGFGTHTTYRRTDAPGQITVVCCECCVPGVSPPFPVRCMLHN